MLLVIRQQPHEIYINESGLYCLMLRSNFTSLKIPTSLLSKWNTRLASEASTSELSLTHQTLTMMKSFDWIKNTIAKEMPKEDEACPADLKDKVDISAPKGSKLKNLNKLNDIVFPEHRHDYENEESNHYLKKHGTKLYLIETVG